MDSKNTTTILFCAIFLILGFILGRVTAHHGGHHGKKGRIECRGHHQTCHGESIGWDEDDEVKHVEVMVLSDEEFSGDTLISMPGKRIRIKKELQGGEEEIEVEVEVEE